MHSTIHKLAIPLLCALLFLPFGGQRAMAAEPVNLSFSFWGSYKDLEFWKDIAQDFEKQHPGVRIELQYTPNDYGEKLQLQLISNSAADIILMDDENYPAYAARGYLEDLGPYVARDRDALKVDDFLPTALEAFTYRGLLASLPWDGMAVLMFYNKDLFDEAGIPYPTEDWTWEDFRRIAKQLTVDRDGDGRPDQFGAILGFGWLDIEPVIWSFGGRLLNKDRTRAAADSPEVYAAAHFM